MALTRDTDLHRRRLSRNLGLGVVLIGFAALVFALTVVKVQNGSKMQAFDHQPRVTLLPATGASQ